MTAVVLALQEGEHAAARAPSSPFEVNFGLFFWTWVVFILLLAVLYKFAFPAILKATEEREQRIKHQLAEAERMNAEARAMMEQHQRLLASAKEQAQALINEAKLVAQHEREALLQKARDEQDQILERAKREIEAERERAVAALRREAVDLSLAAASKLLQERLDDEANRKLVTQYLGSLETKH
ncbi:MAG: F0F1 ATP synthase subunit B [Gemmatimonadetes bacterium]|nr:F0F1 ATP synthase subunit B [Gemmatimonadota bacterium]